MTAVPGLPDVFVIGGGPAGLAAAIAARRRGFAVTVADSAHPPIDKACGEGIMPDGVAAARACGIRFENAGALPFRGIRFCENGQTVAAQFPDGCGLGMRRTRLHEMLADQAAVAGVRLLWGARIGALEDLRARWIIGADGGNSLVRRMAGLDSGRRGSPRYGFRRRYRIAPWSDHMELHWGDACQIYVTPVAADEVCVALLSSDSTVRLEQALLRFPAMMRRLGEASGSSERGGVSVSRQLARVVRGRVALVGDASGSVDAITGEGLCLLFQQAAALAEALESGDLSSYETAHRSIGRRAEFMAKAMLLLDRHSRIRKRAMRAMAARPQLFARLLAMHVGELPPLSAMRNGMALGWRMLTA